MQIDMRPNKKTVDLVKSFEGLELGAYTCPAGVITIGYGYTNRAGFGPGVKIGDKWTQDFADTMLTSGLEVFGREIRPKMTREPSPNQYGAMLSLAYNIGSGAFNSSTCLKRFNAGDIAGAAEALTWFNKAGGEVLAGLVRRREAEKALFLSEVPGDPPVIDAEFLEPATEIPAQGVWAALVALFFTIFGGKK